MTTALKVIEPDVGTRTQFSPEQVALIKRTIGQNEKLTDDEFQLFLYAAQRQGLDPLARQIYAVKRQGKMVVQTSIDGYRLIADRTGAYAGNDDPVFNLVLNDNTTPQGCPESATVTVHKLVAGQRCAFTATARWSEYFPGDAQGFMWRKMPHTMLGKCAEALALRKAFPAELSGTYVDAEMDQAGRGDAPQRPAGVSEDGEVSPALTRAVEGVQSLLDSPVAFGKHKGKTPREIGPDYFDFLLSKMSGDPKGAHEPTRKLCTAVVAAFEDEAEGAREEA